jgi:hypothetical protein
LGLHLRGHRRAGKVVGQVLNTPGVHGVAIAPELRKGITSNVGDKSVTVFDTEDP